MPKTIFKMAAWADIISAILVLPTLILGIMIGMDETNITLATWGIYSTIVLATLSLVILRAYHRISQKYTGLGLITSLNIAFSIIIILVALEKLIFNSLDNMTWSILFLILQGMLVLFFGIRLLSCAASKLTKPLGILYIIIGATYMSVILSIIGALLSIAVAIVEAVMFFRLAKLKKF